MRSNYFNCHETTDYGKENHMIFHSSKLGSQYHNFKENMNMRNRNTDNNTSTASMKEERNMGRIMKTGIIAAGTVAAAGLAFGMSTVTAHAAELDSNDPVIQANTETTVPETIAEAKKAVDTAQANGEAADTAVREAQTKVNEAEQNAASASEATDTARAEVDYAFEVAKSEAAESDAAAQKDVEAAERNVDEADAKVQQAAEDVSSAEEALEEATSSVNEAVSESPVTENDIEEKEAELDEAQTVLSDAEIDLDQAENAKTDAEAAAAKAESAKNSVEEAVREAEAEKTAADDAASAAGEAAGQAAEVLQTAENLKNGTTDIRDTIQYKEEQEAKEMINKAVDKLETAAEDTDVAAEDLANAEAAVEAAESALDSAMEDLNNREDELSEAGKVKEAADNAKADAQNTYDNAAAEAAYIDTAVSDAEYAVAAAREDVKLAESAKEAADNAVDKALAEADTARQNAEAAVNADIANAEKEVAEKQTATEVAQEALETAAEKYKKGTLGLIDWMLVKDGLTKDQTQDLTFAREILVNASEEDFSKWAGGNNTGLPEERAGKVVVIGDEKDATNLENLFKSIEIMKKINELRATDDNYTGELQRNASYTNFYFMATAEAGAMRGAGLRRHSSLTTSCEDLAFGYSDPTVGWYNKEKVIFDRIKGELGIEKITSMDDVAKIEAEADNQGVVVGHYTNLFWAADQLMGVGYTQYRTTSCYNASKASNYTNDHYNRAMHLYTVEDFEQLVNEYYQTVNKTVCEDALEQAAVEQSAAEERLQSLKDGKDFVVETAIQEAKAELSSKEGDAEQAARNLNDAKAILASAEKALEDAGTKKSSADLTLKDALELLNKATLESCAADTDYAFAEKARAEAEQVVTDAENVLKDAMSGKTAAVAVLEEKKATLADANTALDEAKSLYMAAAKRLADLTSDGTMDVLREQKHLADTALQAALDNQIARDEALKQAEAVLAQAESDAADAKNTLQEAEDRLAEAVQARNVAKDAADLAAEELASLREQYAPIFRAIAARDAAKEKLNQAEATLATAKTDLAQAQENLAQAQLAKAITADKLLRATGLSVEDALKADIEDPDFTYLNDYVTAVKVADTALSEAKALLGTAYAELTARKTDSENARKAYIAAVANLVIVQNREGMFQPDLNPSNPSLDSKLFVETSNIKELSTPVVKETAFEPNVLKGLTNISRPVLTKAESTGRVYCTEPVATGDTANVMTLLAELLASVGLMAVVFRRRKEVEENNNQ